MKILFEWPQSLFAATKIFIFILSLTHYLISLMGSFHFPHDGKYFSQFINKLLKILGNGISQLFPLSLKCDHPVLCEFPILFSTGQVKLGQKFSQLIHKFNIWILIVGLGLCVFPSFSQFIKRWEIGIFEKFRSHFQIFPNSLKSLKTEIFFPIWSNGEGGISVRGHVASEEPIYD